MSRPALLAFLLLFLVNNCDAQKGRSLHFGIEQDLLPYATGGYFGGLWIGSGHARLRMITARVHKPDFIIKEGFTNNRVTAYAVIADYFLKEDWQGWWAGGGVVYWKSSIQSNERLSTACFDNVLLNGSIGHSWKWKQWFYLGPWAGIHIRIGGAKQLEVDRKMFKPALLNPEASLKLGWIIH